MSNSVKFVYAKISCGSKTNDEHDCPDEAEQVHRSSAKARYEHNGKQIEEAVQKSFDAEFCVAVFARKMFNDFFPDFPEAGFMCNHRNVAMHFAIHFDAFYNIAAVCFEPAIEVVEIIDTGKFSCRPIE